MKNERWFSKTLRTKCSGPDLNFWSFEWSGHADSPDLYCVARGRGYVTALWIELKVVKHADCLIPFRHGQQKWMRNHAQCGGRALVVIWDDADQSIYIVPDLIAAAIGRDRKIDTVREAHRRISGVKMFKGPRLWEELAAAIRATQFRV
jgi:hypothetical protein